MKNFIRLLLMVFFLGVTETHAQNQQIILNWDINMSRLGARGSSSNEVEVGQGQVYLLLLDYTGSMNTKDDGKNSRWELLKKSLASTIVNLPSGCEVSLKTFSIQTNWRGKQEWKTEEVVRSRISEQKIRLNIIDMINGLRNPDGKNATNLYDAIGEACKNAETLITSGKSVTLVVFTDGEDTGSLDFCAKDNEVSYRGGIRKKLGKHFEGLFKDKGFQAYELPLTPSSDSGSVFPPTPAGGFNELCAVTFPRNELTLAELRSQNVVTIPLDCDFPISESAWKRLMESEVKELDVSLTLGKISTAEKLKIRDGKATIRMEIDGSKLSSEKLDGKLTFSGWPTLKGLIILPPKPIHIVLPEAGKITLGNVRPSSSVIQTGSAIPFMVDVTPKNAQVRWFFSGPQNFEAEGVFVSARKFDVPGKYEFLVKATAANLESAEKKGVVEVVDFSVEVVKSSTMPVVNEDYEVSCRWEGPCERVEWIAEKDQAVTDMGNGKAKYRFFSSGDNTIKVKAFSSKFPTIDAKAAINVKKAPVIGIDKPVSGTTTQINTDIEFIAKTEGGIQSVKWEFLDANGQLIGQLDSVVAGEGMAKGIYRFQKKGTYIVRAFGFAGAVQHKSVNQVTLRVTSPDAKIDIETPMAGDKLRTGDNLVFKARCSIGAGFKELTWYEIQENGTRLVIGTANVASDGISECKSVLDFNAPDRSSRIVVEGKDSTEELAVSPEVLVQIYTECDVDVTKPLEGETFPYRKQVFFEAKVNCNVPDYRVEWFFEDSSKPIGNGKAFAYTFEQDGANAKIYKVLPEIVLPGGRRLKKVARGFKMFCPDLNATIKLPGDKSIYGINMPVEFNLEMQGNAVAEITWSFGLNGVQKKGTGRSENYTFDKTGEYLVSAVAKCKACGKEEKTQPVKVLIDCLPLEPKIILAKTNGVEIAEYGLNEPVNFNLEYKGGVPPNVIWSFGDGTQTAGCVTVSHTYTNHGAKVIFTVATCKSCGKKEDAEHKIKIVKRPPAAKFSIKRGEAVVSGNVIQGSMLQLVCKSAGDVGRREWRCNGKLQEGTGELITVSCDKKGRNEYSLTVYDFDGLVSPWEPAKQSVSAYNLWIILAICFVSILLYGILFWYFSGDEPSAWTIAGYRTDKWDATIKDIRFTVPVKIKPYWNMMHNEAAVPMSKIFPLAKHFKEGKGKEDVVIIAAQDGVPQVRLSAGKLVCLDVMESNKTYRLTDNRLESRDNNDNYKRIWLQVSTRRSGFYFILIKFVLFVVVLGCAMLLSRIFGM